MVYKKLRRWAMMEMLSKAVEELRLVFSQEELKELVNEVVEELTQRLELLFIDLGLEEKFDEFLKGEFNELPDNWQELIIELVLASIGSLTVELERGMLFWDMDEGLMKRIAGVLHLLCSIWLELDMRGIDILKVIKQLSDIGKADEVPQGKSGDDFETSDMYLV
jgi:hypothetical protein